jgi:hypothetical protein
MDTRNHSANTPHRSANTPLAAPPPPPFTSPLYMTALRAISSTRHHQFNRTMFLRVSDWSELHAGLQP